LIALDAVILGPDIRIRNSGIKKIRHIDTVR
jgi:hypothetical protein